jgi:hypothetical protein
MKRCINKRKLPGDKNESRKPNTSHTTPLGGGEHFVCHVVDLVCGSRQRVGADR